MSTDARTCKFCGNLLSRRPKDTPSEFLSRRYCNASCAGSYRAAQQRKQTEPEEIPDGTHGPTRAEYLIEQCRRVREEGFVDSNGREWKRQKLVARERVEVLVVPEPKLGLRR